MSNLQTGSANVSPSRHRDHNLNDRAIVHGIGWLEGPFGYNVHARGFFSALARQVPTLVTPFVGTKGPLEADRRLLGQIRRPQEIISIALLYGNFAGDVLNGAPGARVIYSVWESTRLPMDWLPALHAADQVWTASRWGAAVIARNGVNPDHIHVVPEGVDPAVFNPGVPPADAFTSDSTFKFLNIGRFEDRKGTTLLLRAFDAEFAARDDVNLVIACHNHHQIGFDIGAELRSLGLRHPEKLKFVPPIARHDVLAALYTSCDAFVAPSRAEGWGLPIIEAMACDLPVITTDHSAPLDYIGPETYRITKTMTPIRSAYFDVSDGDLGMWAEPDLADLRRCLREVFENRHAARAAGRSAGRRIRSNFTWDLAASRALRALEALSR
jgi:glycosyltransferase involved in cell wall biosynthesis